MHDQSCCIRIIADGTTDIRNALRVNKRTINPYHHLHTAAHNFRYGYRISVASINCYFYKAAKDVAKWLFILLLSYRGGESNVIIKK